MVERRAEAVASIMDTFPVVRRKDEAQCDGDYRTRRVILDIYDALAASLCTGCAVRSWCWALLGPRCPRGLRVPGGAVPAKADSGPSGRCGAASGVRRKAYACL